MMKLKKQIPEKIQKKMFDQWPEDGFTRIKKMPEETNDEWAEAIGIQMSKGKVKNEPKKKKAPF